jgi:hypothetical protein
MAAAHARPSFRLRPDGAFAKAAAAIRADVEQYVLNAMSAEGALVGADTRLCRFGR